MILRNKRFIFFSFSDFKLSGGTRSRTVPMINCLAKNNMVILISNCKNLNIFDKKVTHIYLNTNFSKFHSRFFLFLISIFNTAILKYFYLKKIKIIEKIFLNIKYSNNKILG